MAPDTDPIGLITNTNVTMAKPHSTLIPDTGTATATALLETFIPGYSLLTRLLITYLQIDLSEYIPYLLAYTVAVAAIRYIFARLRILFRQHFTSTGEIRCDDEVYDYLMHWLSQQEFMSRTTRFVAGTRAPGFPRRSRCGSNAEEGDGDLGLLLGAMANFNTYWAKTTARDRIKPLHFTPSDGTHYFWFRNRPLAFTRYREDNNQGMGHGGLRALERLYITCIGRNPAILKELLIEAQRSYVVKDANNTVIYWFRSDMGSAHWSFSMARPPRPLSTVILDLDQKERLITDIREYLHPEKRRWYSDRGIPYRRGYLLHGPPGTGKTSLCFAVAGLLNLPLYVLNLGSKSLSEDTLSSLFLSLPARCIVLIEDVDCAGMADKRDSADDCNGDDLDGPLPSQPQPATTLPTRRRGAHRLNTPFRFDQGVSLSDVLNAIDGVAACEGRILFMTTNLPEKLDPALTRPGRIDMSIQFGYSTANDIHELFLAIYSALEGDLKPATPSRANPRAADILNTDTKLKDSVNEDSTTVTSKADVFGPAMGNHAPYLQDRVPGWALDFASKVPAGDFTPAEIQGYLLMHKTDPEGAIAGVEEWVTATREMKAAVATGSDVMKEKDESESEKEPTNGLQRVERVRRMLGVLSQEGGPERLAFCQ